MIKVVVSMRIETIFRPILIGLGIVFGSLSWSTTMQAADRPPPPPATRKVEFKSDILPLFQSKCLRCHGDQKQESGFRLDQEESAKKGGEIGEAYTPGDSAQSPMIQYVAGTDDNILMPPDGEGARLSAEEVGLLRAWIDQGAAWPAQANSNASPAKPHVKPPEEHWAYHRPRRAELPSVKSSSWPRNAIDHFVLSRIEQEGMAPSVEAQRATLIRRLSLDLIGLPPTVAELHDFINDASPDAYEKLAERLLASPHYGERWALWWLDLARYADTNGYEVDRPRSIWPYRDWVISALNANMPYNQFVTEQLAGDLLPNATDAQRIATGFHRNTYFNEEGGHDYEQFRWEAIVDRVHTTSTVFLGLTMACAQCHDHKYDPIKQRDYYKFFAFLNNDDEPFFDVATPDVVVKRQKILDEIAQLESRLNDEFPPYVEEPQWEVVRPTRLENMPTSSLQVDDEGFFSVLVNGAKAGDSYIVLPVKSSRVDAFRIEAIPDADELQAFAATPERSTQLLAECDLRASTRQGNTQADGKAVAIKIRKAMAGEDQSIARLLCDNDPSTGWAVDGAKIVQQPASLTLVLEKPISFKGSDRLVVHLDQGAADSQRQRRFRISIGSTQPMRKWADLPEREQREQALAAGFDRWCKESALDARNWTLLDPKRWAVKNNSTVTKLDDSSLLLSGDRPETELIEVKYHVPLGKITGLKLEALPDARLPNHGPGRGYYIDDGTFLLSEFTAAVGDREGDTVRPMKLVNPSALFWAGDKTVDKAIDGEKLTGWHIQGGARRRHTAVFELAEPTIVVDDEELTISCLHHGPHSQVLGRFRIFATSDTAPLSANEWPVHIEQLLATPPEQWTVEDRAALKAYYLTVADELREQRRQIDALRRRLPPLPTTLVLEQRTDLRKTHQHIRGEFRRPGNEVTPDVPGFLHPFPQDAPRNRLGLARWLVDEQNPLIGRVLVNQIWQCYFGRGLVNTPEDFGSQGQLPSHPELLDWLTCQFIEGGWNLKDLHRLIVNSSAYRQSSSATPETLQADPENILLARGPRFRVYAEIVRDIILESSGLLSHTIGGPSVFPSQPEDLYKSAFGNASVWNTSTGADSFRRGLYTQRKRGLYYPAFSTFDAPQQSTCSMRRVRSNTPLQALTLMNDIVVIEAAQAMAQRIIKESAANDVARLQYAFELCLSRQPTESEQKTLLNYCAKMRQQFAEDSSSAAKVAGVTAKESENESTSELAAWSMLSRILLNLDETISKE